MTRKNGKYTKTADAWRDYEVGYAKPPLASRFKPGQSGNPGGRPRGSKNKRTASHEEPLKQIILQEAYRDIDVHDGSKSITMPMVQAVVRSMGVKAGKGDHRSQRLFTEMVSSIEAAAKAQNYEWLELMISMKVDGERELERRKRLGIEGPDLIPHPDDILIDFEKNTATVLGPITKQEKEHLEVLRKARDDVSDQLEELNAELAASKKKAIRVKIEDKIVNIRRLAKKIDKVLGLH